MTAILLFLRTIPPARWAQLAGVLLLAGTFAALGLKLQAAHLATAQAQTAQARAEKDKSDEHALRVADNARMQAAAASAAEKALTDSKLLLNDQQEIEDAHRLIHAQGAAVAAANDAVARSLRDAFRQAAPAPAGGASGAGDPGAVAGGAAGAAPRDLRADVFDEWEGRARTLEGALDDEFERHGNCIAEYGSVRARVNGQQPAALKP
jgi:hypothetical protein